MPAPPGPEPESDPLLWQETFLRWDEGAGEGREGDRRVQCAGDQKEGEAQGETGTVTWLKVEAFSILKSRIASL